jgi:hypothetical protein
MRLIRVLALTLAWMLAPALAYSQSCVLAGTNVLLAGTTAICGVSSGAGPASPTNVVAYVAGTPTTAYVSFQTPANNGSAITSYTATASPSGLTSTAAAFVTPTAALPARVDFSGLPNSSQTFTVTATNANGTSAASSASNAITPSAFNGDTWDDGHNAYYTVSGGSVIGLNAGWGDNYFDFAFYRAVAPGTSTTAGPNYNATYVSSANAPAYPTGVGMTNQLMYEVVPSSQSSGFAIQIWVHITNPTQAHNGTFNLNPYTRFVFYVFPCPADSCAGSFVSGHHVSIPALETTFDYEDVATNVAGNVVTFANQNWGTFNTGNTGVFDRNQSVLTGIASNTSNTITVTSASGWAIGDHIDITTSDQSVGNTINNIDADVISPSAGVLTINAWNRVEVPLNNTGLNVLAANNGKTYKYHVALPSPTNQGGKAAAWFCRVGFVQ